MGYVWIKNIIWCACFINWASWGSGWCSYVLACSWGWLSRWSSWGLSWTLCIFFKITSFYSRVPFKRQITSYAFTVHLIWCLFRADTFLIIPLICFITSQCTFLIRGAPNKWLKACNTFTSKINWWLVWTDTFFFIVIPNFIPCTINCNICYGWGKTFL